MPNREVDSQRNLPAIVRVSKSVPLPAMVMVVVSVVLVVVAVGVVVKMVWLPMVCLALQRRKDGGRSYTKNHKQTLRPPPPPRHPPVRPHLTSPTPSYPIASQEPIYHDGSEIWFHEDVDDKYAKVDESVREEPEYEQVDERWILQGNVERHVQWSDNGVYYDVESLYDDVADGGKESGDVEVDKDETLYYSVVEGKNHESEQSSVYENIPKNSVMTGGVEGGECDVEVDEDEELYRRVVEEKSHEEKVSK
ncbi:hypothetical protein E2C01_052151 [Portunus trituberculatus]|uniref:Uncharacterized protein n=1 Tax=Portunus trituberculatus TaxID=210409 RepID=A0A5B7GKS8_PORTR|nr:hypothetical protein [Portunus trituberculatus]